MSALCGCWENYVTRESVIFQHKEQISSQSFVWMLLGLTCLRWVLVVSIGIHVCHQLWHTNMSCLSASTAAVPGIINCEIYVLNSLQKLRFMFWDLATFMYLNFA